MSSKPPSPHHPESLNGQAGAAGTQGVTQAAAPELYELLAELRKEIDTRRKEQVTQQHSAAEDDIFSMMTELRRDMSVLKRSPASMPVAKPGRPSAPTGSMASRMAGGSVPVIPVSSPIPVSSAAIAKIENTSGIQNLFSQEKRPALSLAAALIVAIGGLYLVTNRTVPGAVRASPGTQVSGTPVAATLLPGDQSASGLGGTPVFDALSAGKVSPQGVSAQGMTATRALARANAQLLATGPARDTQEAAFWLKRYVSGSLGDARMARSLTQLGATYAEQTGKAPDYLKARQVWEMAGALGDPVAMCFLGRLFENGWSVTASSQAALQWYERARDAGGCPGLEESLARVQ
ncbi:MAG: hypothetical protein ABL894_01985 [Hyphomicrobium sp.]